MRKAIALVLLLMGGAQVARADEYPTLERVDYVLTCMREHGGQTVDNLYACACEIDAVAQQVPFDDFTEARTFEIYKRMPGEKGGLFRDSARAKDVVGKLDKARADGKKRCFVGKKVPHADPAKGTPQGGSAGGVPTAITPAPGGS